MNPSDKRAAPPLLLLGYFGHGNAGDEMILDLLREAAAPTAFVSGPRPRGAGAVPKFSPLSLWRALRGSRGLLLGGGELFQSLTSLRSLAYYLALPLAARLAGKPTSAMGLALDPDLPPLFQRVTAAVLRRSRAVVVRDEGSERVLGERGVPVKIMPDMVWAWPHNPAPPAASLRRVLWVPRFSPGGLDEQLLAVALNRLARVRPWSHGLLAFHPEKDGPGIGRLRGGLRFFHRLETWTGLDDIFRRIEEYDLIVTMRFHGLVAAGLAGRAAVALAGHGKVRDLARETGALSLPLDRAAEVDWEDILSRAFARGPLAVGDRPARARQALDNLSLKNP